MLVRRELGRKLLPHCSGDSNGGTSAAETRPRGQMVGEISSPRV